MDPERPRRQPPRALWALLAATSVGAFGGLGGFALYYGEGLSYFSKDPRACANCHIMQPQFDGWQKASHHTSATCVDCHLPDTFVAKYLAKATNGWCHSKGFTMQDFEEPIRIKAANSRILQDSCIRCHADMVHEITDSGELSCVHCHATVGHGPRTGLGGRYRPEERAER